MTADRDTFRLVGPSDAAPQNSEATVAQRRDPRTRLLRFDKRVPVCRRQLRIDEILEVAEGALMLYQLLPDGRRQIVEVLGPGDLYWPAASLSSCQAETLTGVTLIRHSRVNAAHAPEKLLSLLDRMQLQLAGMHDHALLLGRKTAVERVASFLFKCVPVPAGETCAHAADVSRRMNIALTMTRQEIADYLGLTIETVSRVVTDLRHRGLVTIPKLDELVVNDICAICRLATADSAPLETCAPPLSPKPSADGVW